MFQKAFDRRKPLSAAGRLPCSTLYCSTCGKNTASTARRSLFAQLKVTLSEASRSVPYAEMGARLAMSEGAVNVAVHRLHQRYRELLRAEIAETVASVGEVQAAIRNLFAALSN